MTLGSNEANRTRRMSFVRPDEPRRKPLGERHSELISVGRTHLFSRNGGGEESSVRLEPRLSVTRHPAFEGVAPFDEGVRAGHKRRQLNTNCSWHSADERITCSNVGVATDTRQGDRGKGK